jgi:hypothetical protein
METIYRRTATSDKAALDSLGISRFAYLAIKLSNDYRSLHPQIDDVYKLNNLLVKVSDDEAKTKKTEVSQQDMKIHILFELSQKQFWYQEIIRATNIYYNFLLNIFILDVMKKRGLNKLLSISLQGMDRGFTLPSVYNRLAVSHFYRFCPFLSCLANMLSKYSFLL